MAFVTDFFKNAIVAYMEDPAEREAKAHAHIRSVAAAADELKAQWAQPQKQYGYWTSANNNYVLNSTETLGLSKYPGRAQYY